MPDKVMIAMSTKTVVLFDAQRRQPKLTQLSLRILGSFHSWLANQDSINVTRSPSTTRPPRSITRSPGFNPDSMRRRPSDTTPVSMAASSPRRHAPRTHTLAVGVLLHDGRRQCDGTVQGEVRDVNGDHVAALRSAGPPSSRRGWPPRCIAPRGEFGSPWGPTLGLPRGPVGLRSPTPRSGH